MSSHMQSNQVKRKCRCSLQQSTQRAPDKWVLEHMALFSAWARERERERERVCVFVCFNVCWACSLPGCYTKNGNWEIWAVAVVACCNLSINNNWCFICEVISKTPTDQQLNVTFIVCTNSFEYCPKRSSICEVISKMLTNSILHLLLAKKIIQILSFIMYK